MNKVGFILGFLGLACLCPLGLCCAQSATPEGRLLSDAPAGVREQVERLHSFDPVERRNAAQELGGMGEEAVAAVPALIRALNDSARLAVREKPGRRGIPGLGGRGCDVGPGESGCTCGRSAHRFPPQRQTRGQDDGHGRFGKDTGPEDDRTPDRGPRNGPGFPGAGRCGGRPAEEAGSSNTGSAAPGRAERELGGQEPGKERSGRGEGNARGGRPLPGEAPSGRETRPGRKAPVEKVTDEDLIPWGGGTAPSEEPEAAEPAEPAEEVSHIVER